MTMFLLLAPLFLGFEVWQLVISERYLGIKQIARGADPRLLGLGEITAFFWSMTILAYWLWMLALLLTPHARVYGVTLLAVSALGLSLRRSSSLKFVLVILTLEGAVRIGFLVSLCTMLWLQF